MFSQDYDESCFQRVLAEAATRLEKTQATVTCPISLERMHNPVVAADGFSYNEKPISDWLQKQSTSPQLGSPLPHPHLLQNHTLKTLIHELYGSAPAARSHTPTEQGLLDFLFDALKEACHRAVIAEARVQQYEYHAHDESPGSSDTLRSEQGDLFFDLIESLHPVQHASTQGTHPMGFFTKKKTEEEKTLSSPLLRCKSLIEAGINEWTEQARLNNPEAKALLGRAYLMGLGVGMNTETATRLLREASTSDTPAGFWALGLCYQEGLYFNKNATLAIHCFQKAAELGYPPAQTSLGRCYIKGIGITMDVARGIRLYRAAADAHYAGAYVSLALCYQKGIGVPACPSEAVKYLQQAIEVGHVGALYHLGLIYLHGYGVPVDKAKAKEYLSLAFELGIQDAKNPYQSLGSFMK